MFCQKGGGSANKSFLFQETKAILNPDALMKFLDTKIRTLGTAACPPYHLAIVIGGPSAEFNMKTVKLASTKYLDGLPTQGSESGHAFRDMEMEQQVLKLTQDMGIGVSLWRYYCHDVDYRRRATVHPCPSASGCPARRPPMLRQDHQGRHC